MVGVQLSGKLSLVRAAAGTAVTSDATALPAGITTAANYDAVNDTTKTYALELSKKAVAPVVQNDTAGNEANAQGGIANEVTTLQAGGTLIWANGAVKPTDEFSERSGDDAEGATPDYSGANQFTPSASGVYIFRRNVAVTDTGAESYKYSGYLYVKGSSSPTDDKYYAFETITTDEGATTPYIKDIAVTYNADGTVASISGLKLATVQKSVIDATLDYTDVADTTAPKIVAKDAASGEKIAIDINLNPAYATNWQYVANKGFFYKDDLEEGATTTRLVDSVTLSDTVKNGAYLAMDFDLNVAHESVQVTKDASGNEAAPATTIFGATPTATNTGAEITAVSWS